MADGFRIPIVDFGPREGNKNASNRNSQVGEFSDHQWSSSQPYIDAFELAAAWPILFPTPTNRFINWPAPPTAMAFNRNSLGGSPPQQIMSTTTARPNKRTRAESPPRSTAAPAPKRQKILTKKQKKRQAKMAKSALEDVGYQDLKDWIAMQESLPEPVPLTDVQRRAIADLRDSLKTSSVSNTELDLGDKDWVSLLHRYRDAHQQLGVVVEFHEDAGPLGNWMCSCTIRSSIRNQEGDSMDRRFPDLDLGFVPMGPDGGLRQPTFARKKDAKRYAAKCCVEYLMRENLMPRDGENVTFPKPKPAPPPPKKKKNPNPVFESANNGMSTWKTSTTASGFLSSKAFPPTGGLSTPAQATRDTTKQNPQVSVGERAEPAGGGAPLDVRNEDFSATERVMEMCNRLSISQPSYKIEKADPAMPDIYNGYADFGLDSVHIPDTVGRVVNCYSKKFTKEKVAEEVLDYLFKIEAQRKAAADELMTIMAGRELVSDEP